MIPNSPAWRSQTWRAFLPARADTILAVGFFHPGTVFLRRVHALSVARHRTRVCLAGITASPAGGWVTQQARNPDN